MRLPFRRFFRAVADRARMLGQRKGKSERKAPVRTEPADFDEPPTVSIGLDDNMQREMAGNLHRLASAKGFRINRKPEEVQIVRADGRTLIISARSDPRISLKFSVNVEEEPTESGKNPSLYVKLPGKDSLLFLTKKSPGVFISEPFGRLHVAAANLPSEFISKFQGHFEVRYEGADKKPRVYFYNFGRPNCTSSLG
ncbi:MAG: hypothetical protein AABW72_01295 [archaeon]